MCVILVELSFDTIMSVLGIYDEVKGVYATDESRTHVIISYHKKSSIHVALKKLDGRPCSHL